MSNEQTVRDALNPWLTFVADDGFMAMRVREDDEIAERLDINPDMTVTELQRRLRIAERVLGCLPVPPAKNRVRTDKFGWTKDAAELLAWLARGDAQ